MNANEVEIISSKRRIPRISKDKEEEPSNSRDETPPKSNLNSRLVELSKENGKDVVDKPQRGAWLSEQYKEYFAKNKVDDSRPSNEEIVKQIRLPSEDQVADFQEPINNWSMVEEGEVNVIPTWDKNLLPDEEVIHDVNWRPPTPPPYDVYSFVHEFKHEERNIPKINKVLKEGDSLDDCLRCLDKYDEVVFEDGFTLMRVPKRELEKRMKSHVDRDQRGWNDHRRRQDGGRGGRSYGGGHDRRNRDRRDSSSHHDRRHHGRSRSRSPVRNRSDSRRDYYKETKEYNRHDGRSGYRRESRDERDRRDRNYSSGRYHDRDRYEEGREYIERDGEDSKPRIKSEVVMKDENSSRSGLSGARTFKEYREMKARMAADKK